jgi:hypothetical protein
VTAIIGLRGFPGVVLCADSEETISGYSKKQVDKIEQWVHEPFRFSIGAAGCGHYADMLAASIAEELLKVDTFDLARIHGAIQSELLAFHETHIWPRVNQESAVESSVQLIIVVQPLPSGQVEIIETKETAVLPLTKRCYVSIGVGSHLADYILERVFTPSSGEAHILAAAHYVLREVTDNIAGCGKEPNIALYRNDGTTDWLFFEEVEQLEDALDSWADIHKKTFSAVTDTGPTERCFMNIDQVIEDLPKVRALFSDATESRVERERRYREWVHKGRRSPGGT